MDHRDTAGHHGFSGMVSGGLYSASWRESSIQGSNRLTADPAWFVWLLGWLGGYIAAWGGSVALAIETYNNLPTRPPQTCYIATAAARGHRRWVGADTVRAHDGTPFRVNRQVRILKCTELALQTLLPRTHRRCRAVYDTIGPVLARCLMHPLLADAAYGGVVAGAMDGSVCVAAADAGH